MRRMFFVAVSLLLASSLVGCNNRGYSHQEAIKKGDVVYLNGVYNFERFEQFLSNLANDTKDSIRVTGYTDEGDPIFKDLEYDGQVIHYSYDNSNDAYGGNKKGIQMDECSEVIKEDNVEGEDRYIISGCTSNNPDISYFLLRVDKKNN